MYCLSALNESSRDAHIQQHRAAVEVGVTKEAQESEAMSLYTEALHLRQQGCRELAQQTFVKILDLPFIQKTADCVVSRDEGVVAPAVLLRYSVLKNLAELADSDNLPNVALDYYTLAVEIDGTDVSVWFKIGKLALSISNYTLARHAFEMGLEANPRHWPCLDQVITILYALNNYESCLHYIAKALDRDPFYTKGVVLRDRIFSECSYLQMWSLDFFQKCEISLTIEDVSEEESRKFVDEALAMRKNKQQLACRPDPQPVTLSQPLETVTWKCLGSYLLNVYRTINARLSETSDGELSLPTLCSRVSFQVDELTRRSSVELEPPLEPERNESAAVIGPLPMASTNELVAEPIVEPPVTPVQASLPVEVVDSDSAPKKGRKRKLLADDLQSPGSDASKRRSARMRGCSSRTKTQEEEKVDYRESIRSFIPSSLLGNDSYLSSGGANVPQASIFEQSGMTAVNHSAASGGDGGGKMDVDDEAKFASGSNATRDEFVDENEAVVNFLHQHEVNAGIIDILLAYLIDLSRHDHVKWPEGLADVYLAIYSKLRKHVVYPDCFSSDNSKTRIRDLAQVCLVEMELVVDKLHRVTGSSSLMTSNSPKKNPLVSSVSVESLNRFYAEDLRYLVGVGNADDVFDESYRKEFVTRVSWLHGRYSVIRNDVNIAIHHFNETIEQLELSEADDSGKKTVIRLPNCAVDGSISTETVKEQLESIQKSRSLDDVYRLFETNQHERVILLLLPLFSDCGSVDITQPDRTTQLLLLIDSLINVHNIQTAINCIESVFNEIIKKCSFNVLNGGEVSEIVCQLLSKLCSCVDTDEMNVLANLSPTVRSRLVGNLVELIAVVHEQTHTTVSGGLLRSSPWILLFKLIRFGERWEMREKSLAEHSGESLQSSLALLISVHEHLARNNWCMLEKGKLLLFTVRMLSEELSKWNCEEPHPFKDEIEPALAQCFYCLYGHPNKRSRSKQLEDHNVAPIALMWENCQDVFNFFKPKVLPEYDSYKTSAVSAELESLLRRILSLVPPTAALEGVTIETLLSYIEGIVTELPPVNISNCSDFQPLIEEIYYLMADYYFKNKEMKKAVKFYMHDLCINPDRFDSWAGMALARASQLETKLTAHELKLDTVIEKPSVSTLRCFKRALELDKSNIKLWIEYGTCAYMLHSHASRILKQELFSAVSSPTLPQEIVEQAKKNYFDMLTLAESCFQSASDALSSADSDETDSSEKWLLNYMLGKIAEKLKKPPSVYLNYYREAALNLHEEKAKYPKKIMYYTAAHLSVESLEIYYRVHCSIIKHLLKYEANKSSIPFALFSHRIQLCANSPFITCVEKDRKQEKKADTHDLDESSFSTIGLSADKALSSTERVTRCTRSRGGGGGGGSGGRGSGVDHTYFKTKMPDCAVNFTPSSSTADLVSYASSSSSVAVPLQLTNPNTLDVAQQLNLVPHSGHPGLCSPSYQQSTPAVIGAFPTSPLGQVTPGMPVLQQPVFGSPPAHSLSGPSSSVSLDDVIARQIALIQSPSHVTDVPLDLSPSRQRVQHAPASAASRSPQLARSPSYLHPLSVAGQNATSPSHQLDFASSGNQYFNAGLGYQLAASPGRSSATSPSSSFSHLSAAGPCVQTSPTEASPSNAVSAVEIQLPTPASSIFRPTCIGVSAAVEDANVNLEPPTSHVDKLTVSHSDELALRAEVVGMSFKVEADMNEAKDPHVTETDVHLTGSITTEAVCAARNGDDVITHTMTQHESGVEEAELKLALGVNDSVKAYAVLSDSANAAPDVNSAGDVGGGGGVEAIDNDDEVKSEESRKVVDDTQTSSRDDAELLVGVHDVKSEVSDEINISAAAAAVDGGDRVLAAAAVGNVTIKIELAESSPANEAACIETTAGEAAQGFDCVSTASQPTAAGDRSKSSVENSTDVPSESMKSEFGVDPVAESGRRDRWETSVESAPSERTADDNVESSGTDCEKQVGSLSSSAQAVADQSPTVVKQQRQLELVEASSSLQSLLPNSELDELSTEMVEASAGYTESTPMSVDLVVDSSTAVSANESSGGGDVEVETIATVEINYETSASFAAASESNSMAESSSSASCPAVTSARELDSGAQEKRIPVQTKVTSDSRITENLSAAVVDSKMDTSDVHVDSRDVATAAADGVADVPSIESQCVSNDQAFDEAGFVADHVRNSDDENVAEKLEEKAPTEDAKVGRMEEMGDEIDEKMDVEPVHETDGEKPNRTDTAAEKTSVTDVAEAGKSPDDIESRKSDVKKTGEGEAEGAGDANDRQLAISSKVIVSGSDGDEPAKSSASSTGRDETEKETDDVLFEQLMTQCIKALEICLTRFSQHYKSVYRLADIYFRSPRFKNVNFSRDLLLGAAQNASSLAHMPCPGLFQDRKPSNLFQGLWRIPSPEVDRAGSFAYHLCRALLLLLNVLKSTEDTKLLFNIHKQLAPTPDVDKKYLRDVDRIHLSQTAFVYSLDALQEQIKNLPTMSTDVIYDLLVQASLMRPHAVKMSLHVDKVEDMLQTIYQAYTGQKEKCRVEEILQHCSRLQAAKLAQDKVLHASHTSRSMSPTSNVVKSARNLSSSALTATSCSTSSQTGGPTVMTSSSSFSTSSVVTPVHLVSNISQKSGAGCISQPNFLSRYPVVSLSRDESLSKASPKIWRPVGDSMETGETSSLSTAGEPSKNDRMFTTGQKATPQTSRLTTGVESHGYGLTTSGLHKTKDDRNPLSRSGQQRQHVGYANAAGYRPTPKHGGSDMHANVVAGHPVAGRPQFSLQTSEEFLESTRREHRLPFVVTSRLPDDYDSDSEVERINEREMRQQSTEPARDYVSNEDDDDDDDEVVIILSSDEDE